MFDEALMKRTFEEHLLPFCDGGAVIDRCRRIWSKYRALEGTSQALYRVEFADPARGGRFSERLYVTIPGESRLAPGMPERGEREEGARRDGTALRLAYLYLDHLELLIQVFPTDMRLPQLGPLVNPATILRHLPARTELDKMGSPRVTVLKYKPEKRCVIRYDGSAGVGTVPPINECSVIGKTFCDERGKRIFGIMRFLRGAGVPVPEPLSYVPELRLLVMEALSGRELGSFAREPDFAPYVEEAARAVGELHRVAVDDRVARRVSLDEEGEGFARLVEEFRRECPSLEKRLESLASTILLKLKSSGEEHFSFVHGELDPSQLMVSDGKIWLIDFDRCRVSHPAIDIGRFLAYLNRLALKLHGDPARLRGMEKLFLEAYCALCPRDIQSLILVCQAMECVRIAFILLRRRKSGWGHRLASMCEMAEKVLSSA